MKKITLFALILALALSLAACGTNANTEPETTDAPETTGVVTEPEKTTEPAQTTEPEETPEPTEEPEESTEPEETTEPTEEPEASKGGTAAIIMDDGPQQADVSEGTIRGGTNQNDAVLLPMNTKLYGTAKDGKGLWYAFTTGADANAVYKVTTINKSGEGYIGAFFYDNTGKIIYGFASPSSLSAAWQTVPGSANTGTIKDLEPNTVYYIKMAVTDSGAYYSDGKDGTIDYMLLIRDSSEQSDAYATEDTLLAARGETAALEGEINPGRNQDDAAYIPTGAKIGGTVSDSVGSWFAFTTNETAGAYEITTVDMTSDAEYLGMFLFDEYGGVIGKTAAGSDGTARTYTTDKLSPNTTYYVMLTVTSSDAYSVNREGTIEYTLQINAPKAPEANTATIEQPEEQLVFQQPFELNETMIMFKAESAEFVDPAAAEAALKPVADVILAHPDHPILLAGTTATDGDQENRRGLSERRAEAVKKMLVDKFGVPESQIQTIGLGYADDPFVRGKDRIPEGDVNGQFVETEGAKNRRVIVLDVNDPIAQEILNK